MMSEAEHFLVPINHLYVFSGKMSIQILDSLFNHIVWVFAIELYEFLYTLDTNILTDIQLKVFFSIQRAAF